MVDLMVSEQRSGTVGKGVPAGFKLTEVGVIPEDWECVPFGNLFKTSIKKKNVSEHELVSFIGMQDVSEDAQLKNSIQIPFKEVKDGFTYFEKGDVLLAKITPCFENGKGCHTAELLTSIGFGSTEFHVLRESEDSDSRFIYYWTTDKKFRASLESEMVGSAGHRRVPLVAIKTFLIPCPKNKQEQSAIANTLSDIDDFILASEKLIAKKQAIKTATMQQLLTGKTRLPQFALRDDGSVKEYKKSELGEIPEDWSCINLGELGNCIIGLTYKPEDISDYGILVLRSSNIQNNHLAYDDNVFVSIEPPERTIVKEGDILVCVRNGSRQLIGKCALIDKNAQGSAFGAFMSIFRTDIYEFIFHQFQSNVIQKQIAEIMGATINQITNKDMLGFKIPLPENKEEQTAIAVILSDMDKEIQTLQQRLDKTRQLKQGMMQELLTGKTRLIERN